MLGLIALILHHLLPQHMSHTQSGDCVISIDAGKVCVCVYVWKNMVMVICTSGLFSNSQDTYVYHVYVPMGN